jgi:hypothetical protein
VSTGCRKGMAFFLLMMSIMIYAGGRGGRGDESRGREELRQADRQRDRQIASQTSSKVAANDT